MSWLAPNCYREWRADALDSALREATDTALPSERLLQQIWFHQRLRRDDLRTFDGRPVTVLHPGFWNHEAGPDFRQAVVQLGDGPARSGDVEVDLDPAGWRQHRHHDNPAYRQVLLHVVWTVKGAPAGDLPVLPLAERLDAPLADLRQWLATEATHPVPIAPPGRCAPEFHALPAEAVAALWPQAALVRFQRKAAWFQARARHVGWQQALWEGLFPALGYKHNPWPMRRLAELLPDLRQGLPTDRALALQARLLGVSGLLPAEWGPADRSTDAYLKRAWDHWWRERAAFAEVQVPRTAWRLHGLRPANHPQRRLALAAHWLTTPDWIERLEAWFGNEGSPAALSRSLLALLQVERDEFWSWHWTLRSPRLPRAHPLLGPPRATDLAVNVLLPWFWGRAASGRAEASRRRVEERFLAWPAGEDNAVLRLARQRFFGRGRARLPRRAAVQQGFIQVVRDHCDHANALCEGCRFPELLRRLKSPTAPPS